MGSTDDTRYTKIVQYGGNGDKEINLPSSTKHFRARYVQIILSNPQDTIYHPDTYGNYQSLRKVLGVKEFQIFEHTGGGGVFGIQTVDGSVYNTITYAQRQPGTWMSGSEGDVRTDDVAGVQEIPGRKVQIVVTYRSVHDGDPSSPLTEVSLYRDGEAYGKHYVKGDWMEFPNNTRLVFGVRSTAYAD